MNRCELTFLDRQEIDIAKASEQHRSYELCLASLGVVVVPLPAEPDLPDSVFVEDPAVVVDEVAVITRMGVESRRRESELLARAIEVYRPLNWLEAPATLEGGDVVRVGRRIFVGRSRRTNDEGIRQLSALLSPCEYTVDTRWMSTAACTSNRPAARWIAAPCWLTGNGSTRRRSKTCG